MRNLSLDYLKIILAFFVVCLHSGFFYDLNREIGYLLVNGIFRIAVPIFLIINGYYFYNINSLKDLSKWCKRIFILYLTWTIIYLPVMFYNLTPVQIIWSLFTGYFILWYLVAVLFASIVLFFIKNFSDQLLIVISLFLICVGYIIQTLGNLHIYEGFLDDLLNWGPIVRNFLLFGLPFMIIGFLLHRRNLIIKKNYLILSCIFFLICLLFESYVNYFFTKEPVDILLSLFFLCPCVFLLVKSLKIKGKNKNIANFSTSIFLIHTYVLLILRHFLNLENTLLALLTIFFSSIISLFIVQFNTKVKFLL